MGPAKDKHGVRESFAKVKFLFAKNGRSGIKEFWSTTIYIYAIIYSYPESWMAQKENMKLRIAIEYAWHTYLSEQFRDAPVAVCLHYDWEICYLYLLLIYFWSCIPIGMVNPFIIFNHSQSIWWYHQCLILQVDPDVRGSDLDFFRDQIEHPGVAKVLVWIANIIQFCVYEYNII